MKRNALTMDTKDWIIMRLMRVIAESSVNLTCHLDYCNAALWIAHNIEMCPGENDPFDLLHKEARRRLRKPAPSIDPHLMTGFPRLLTAAARRLGSRRQQAAA